MYIRDRIMGNIKYPEKARHMNWEGVVLISFMVTAEGGVESILIVSSSGFHCLIAIRLMPFSSLLLFQNRQCPPK
jgi:outer membrane biosynthesis protein TonB